jgi:hypothetical protein
MARVVCKVSARDGRLSFTWSEGPDAFKPYHLRGPFLRLFDRAATEARQALADLVEHYCKGRDEEAWQDAYAAQMLAKLSLLGMRERLEPPATAELRRCQGRLAELPSVLAPGEAPWPADAFQEGVRAVRDAEAAADRALADEGDRRLDGVVRQIDDAVQKLTALSLPPQPR